MLYACMHAISILQKNGWVNENTTFILEKEVKDHFNSSLTIVDQRIYGGTEINILRYGQI